MEIRSMAWRAVCSGMVGSLLWFGVANSQPFRGGLPACRAALGTCQSELEACQPALDACQPALGTCQDDLKIVDAALEMCQEDLAACQDDLAACPDQAFPATGQTSCWNRSGTEIDCTGTGHDGDPPPAGAALSYTDNDDGTVTDDNTGLMWEKKSDDGTIHDQDKTYLWEDAFDHVAQLNAIHFAGHSDWRLPNVRELLSIVNYEEFQPAVSEEFNKNCILSCSVTECSCTAPTVYWSSTSVSRPGLQSNAWGVSFFHGEAGFHSKTLIGRRVRAVRGPGP